MILVTGASGFVGSAVVEDLARRYPGAVRAAVRRAPSSRDARLDYAVVEGLAPEADWTAALRGVTTVVHAAARVHVMRDRTSNPLDEYRRVNVAGTMRLGEQAAAAGVARFVFVSSIKVNGESSPRDRPFAASDEPRPLDPYGVSKLEGERGLAALAARTGLGVVVIRPPLVYGPGVKANFFSMMKWLDRGVPLPFGAIHNRRSLVALGNLVDLIARCVEHPAALGQTFLVSDGEDLSTTDLLRRLAAALGRPARLLPIPGAVLAGLATAVGGAKLAQRLCGSLCVDIAPTRARLAWSPPVSVDEGLRVTVEAFRREARA